MQSTLLGMITKTDCKLIYNDSEKDSKMDLFYSFFPALYHVLTKVLVPLTTNFSKKYH